MEKVVLATSLWQLIIKFFKKKVQQIQRSLSKVNPKKLQSLQLSVMYSFAVVDLSYCVLNNIFSSGYIPEGLDAFYPYVKEILQAPLFKLWGSPEKVFFMSYVVIEVVLVRNLIKFSKLVKYNILLVFACLMIQGLVVSYWDLLFHREISKAVGFWSYDGGSMIHTDRNVSAFFFFLTFLTFICWYLFLYTRAMKGIFGTFRGMEWLTDSVAFWLRIKTPTMRNGIRKNED